MEKHNFSLNQFERHSVKNRVTSLDWKALVIILILIIAISKSYGQSAMEYNAMLTQMEGSGDTTLMEEALHIKNLVTDLQPTVYVGDVIRTSGESDPVRADVKAGAISKLNIENPLFGQVEMITLRINTQADLSAVLDLSAIQGFTNLKYVRLLCSFACAAEQLNTIVAGNTTGVKVFYSISIPS